MITNLIVMACRVVEWVGRVRKSHGLPNRPWLSRDQFQLEKAKSERGGDGGSNVLGWCVVVA